ncbi:MAG: DUF362 domain-containing protein [Lentisphaeria bacterium]|nr:DUF362 domain-containing protein [Lentisphaeria bacterium]
MKVKVSFARAADYTPENLRPALERVFAAQAAAYGSLEGKKVMLKPNLLAWKHENDPACVHPRFIVETAALFLRAGAARVCLLENPAVRQVPAILEDMGIAQELKAMGVEFANFADYRQRTLPGNAVFKTAETAVEHLDFDCVVNLAKVKTHGMMTLTLAVKNLFGFVSGSERLAWHLKVRRDFALFADFLLDLYLDIRPDFNFLDGITAMEGNGPGSGTPVACCFVAGSCDAAALDAAVAPLLGVRDLLTVTRAEARGLLPEYVCEGDIPRLQPLKRPDPPAPLSQWGLPLPTGIREIMRDRLLARPFLDKEKCIGCGLCARMCPPQSLKIREGKPVFKLDECIRCCCCQEHCPKGAIRFRNNLFLRGIEKLRSLISLLAG